MGEFEEVPVSNQHFSDQEMQSQMNVLMATVKTLTGAVSVIKEKHNFFVSEVAATFRRTEERFKHDEQRWDMCEQELQGIKGMLNKHSQGFADCENFVKSGLTAAAEKMNLYEAELKQLTTNMSDRAAYVQHHMIPEAMEEFHGRTNRELENFKNSWLPQTFKAMEVSIGETVSAKIQTGLTENLEAHLKDLIDGRVTVAFNEVEKRLQTLSEVTSAQLTAMEQHVVAGGIQCPCFDGKCPCRCSQTGGPEPPIRAPPSMDPLQTNCPWQRNLFGSPPGVPVPHHSIATPQPGVHPGGRGGDGAPGVHLEAEEPTERQVTEPSGLLRAWV